MYVPTWFAGLQNAYVFQHWNAITVTHEVTTNPAASKGRPSQPLDQVW